MCKHLLYLTICKQSGFGQDENYSYFNKHDPFLWDFFKRNINPKDEEILKLSLGNFEAKKYCESIEEKINTLKKIDNLFNEKPDFSQNGTVQKLKPKPNAKYNYNIIWDNQRSHKVKTSIIKVSNYVKISDDKNSLFGFKVEYISKEKNDKIKKFVDYFNSTVDEVNFLFFYFIEYENEKLKNEFEKKIKKIGDDIKKKLV